MRYLVLQTFPAQPRPSGGRTAGSSRTSAVHGYCTQTCGVPAASTLLQGQGRLIPESHQITPLLKYTRSTLLIK